jgi:hypothetical protein
MLGVAARLERQLGEGRAVEHVDDLDACRVERALEASAGHHRRQVIGNRVGLQHGEELVFEREVAGVAGSVELGVPDHLPSRALDAQEPTLVERKAFVADGRRMRRRRHEQIERLGSALREGGLVLPNHEEPAARLALDAATGELALDHLVHARAARFREGGFAGDEPDIHGSRACSRPSHVSNMSATS